MSILQINEIFYSIQGEGAATGQAAIFIRLTGCNLECSFCDTQHKTGTGQTVEEALAIIDGVLRARWAGTGSPPRVIFTGGEPLLQDFEGLAEVLSRRGHLIAVETNGTINPPRLGVGGLLDWITVSPKSWPIAIPHHLVSELKWVLTPELLAEYPAGPPRLEEPLAVHYLQPMSNHPDMIREAVNLIKQDPRWRLSLQTQKYGDFQ